MGALPKRKISKSRKGRRRAHHALKTPAYGPCPNCGEPKRPHFVCENCGKYAAAETKQKVAKSKAK